MAGGGGEEDGCWGIGGWWGEAGVGEGHGCGGCGGCGGGGVEVEVWSLCLVR